MEFVEAPAFTRHLSAYLNDDDYRELQARLGASPERGDLMPGTGGFESYAGPTRGAARGGEAGCGLSISISRPIIRFG
jgi:hypothetical protein